MSQLDGFFTYFRKKIAVLFIFSAKIGVICVIQSRLNTENFHKRQDE